MKSQRYRKDAKWIFWIGFPLCVVAAALYCALTFTKVVDVAFEWEILAIIGGVALIFVVLSLWLLCLSVSCREKEKRDEDLMAEMPEYAVDEEFTEWDVQAPIGRSYSAHVSIGTNARPNAKKDGEKKPIPENVKKIAKIAVPAVIGVACGVAVAASANAKDRKQAKRRKEFYRWLG